MILYCYDEIGVYTGPISPALSPARPFVDGQPNFLRPARSTDKVPPASRKGMAVVFNGSSWTMQEDHRGNVAYDTTTGNPRTILELGPLPEGCTELVPPSDCHVWDGQVWREDATLLLNVVRRTRNAKLAASDWTQLADVALSTELKAAWASYRQELRDYPSGWTKEKTWPQAPTE